MPRLSRVLFLIAGISLMVAGMLSAYGFHGLPGKVPDGSSLRPCAHGRRSASRSSR